MSTPTDDQIAALAAYGEAERLVATYRDAVRHRATGVNDTSLRTIHKAISRAIVRKPMSEVELMCASLAAMDREFAYRVLGLASEFTAQLRESRFTATEVNPEVEPETALAAEYIASCRNNEKTAMRQLWGALFDLGEIPGRVLNDDSEHGRIAYSIMLFVLELTRRAARAAAYADVP